jgi:MerR family transcriptional regulator, copper efflux regulator
MRITQAAAKLGLSARMLRYREALGLLPPTHDGRAAGAHRHYDEADLSAVALALSLERRYDVSPAALAFALRVLGEPDVAKSVRELGQQLGRLTPPPTRALDFEKQRALRWLNAATPPPSHGG